VRVSLKPWVVWADVVYLLWWLHLCLDGLHSVLQSGIAESQSVPDTPDTVQSQTHGTRQLLVSGRILSSLLLNAGNLSLLSLDLLLQRLNLGLQILGLLSGCRILGSLYAIQTQCHQLRALRNGGLSGTDGVANLVELGVDSDEVVGDAESSGEEESHTQSESGKVH